MDNVLSCYSNLIGEISKIGTVISNIGGHCEGGRLGRGRQGTRQTQERVNGREPALSADPASLLDRKFYQTKHIHRDHGGVSRLNGRVFKKHGESHCWIATSGCKSVSLLDTAKKWGNMMSLHWFNPQKI